MPPIRPELLDELLKDYQKPEDLLGQDGLLQQLTKALVERALGGELTHHLGYDKHAPEGRNSGSSRNGTTPKTLRGKRGQVQIDVPRDRNSEFEPQLVKKGQTRFDGLDEKIISLYARGMTQREIQGHLEEIYGVEISPSLISTVTDAVMDEVRVWQSRPLDSVYPILYLDALQVKVKSQGRVTSKAIHIAFGVNLQGLKEVLGMWAAESEGAKFWMQVVTELKNRGVQNIFIACVDGLKGFPEAIEAVFPQAQVQLCMVHLVRHSLSYVSHKDRKQVANDLKAVYQAATLEEGERQLAEFEETWAASYPDRPPLTDQEVLDDPGPQARVGAAGRLVPPARSLREAEAGHLLLARFRTRGRGARRAVRGRLDARRARRREAPPAEAGSLTPDRLHLHVALPRPTRRDVFVVGG
ncbi:MAG: IS256 family transposase, partial [Acidobacteriota bacterium]|nr:IS256 family transposase [Acidobacteriota bacterium]